MSQNPLKVFITFPTDDRAFAREIESHIVKCRFSVTTSLTASANGMNYMENADVIVLIITAYTHSCVVATRELDDTRRITESDPNKGLIAAVIGEANIPEWIPLTSIVQCSEESRASTIGHYLAVLLEQFRLRIEERNEEQKETLKRIEDSASVYIVKTIRTLEKRERYFKNTANLWYVASYASLACSAFVAYQRGNILTPMPVLQHMNWPQISLETIRSVVLITILIAMSKYSFTLANTHMNESLRNSDRQHAISFGEFYLKAYGPTATWEELKDAFQQWNIDTSSPFTKLQSNDFDPKFLDAIRDGIKEIVDKGSKGTDKK